MKLDLDGYDNPFLITNRKSIQGGTHYGKHHRLCPALHFRLAFSCREAGCEVHPSVSGTRQGKAAGRAIDALDPEYCHIAYKLCRAVQFACVVGIVFNVLFMKDILDSVLGIAVTIMFIVGMNKVCKRIVERF